MKRHLSYDGNQNNGIVFNNTYTWGALYVGAELKPKLSFQYDSMQASEVFNNYYVILDGKRRTMTEVEKQEVLSMAQSWVQSLGQEGNPDKYQVQEQENNKNRQYLASTDWYIIRQQERAIEVPQDILDERQKARDAIVEPIPEEWKGIKP